MALALLRAPHPSPISDLHAQSKGATHITCHLVTVVNAVALKLAKNLWTLSRQHGRTAQLPPLLVDSTNGVVMQHALFSRSAVYDPHTLKTAGQAFDSAWASIASNFVDAAREQAREKLAIIVLQLAADRTSDDLLELKCRAIGEMRLPRVA
jgi:hypothetical protein